jgi:phospholipid/cholesterol/gamma-HCH transport system substrate-binding protein
MTIRDDVELPKDSSIEVASESLLGGVYLLVQQGSDETMLKPGQTITIIQGAVSLQDLLGKFIFSATNMVNVMTGKGARSGQGGAASSGGHQP